MPGLQVAVGTGPRPPRPGCDVLGGTLCQSTPATARPPRLRLVPPSPPPPPSAQRGTQAAECRCPAPNCSHAQPDQELTREKHAQSARRGRRRLADVPGEGSRGVWAPRRRVCHLPCPPPPPTPRLPGSMQATEPSPRLRGAGSDAGRAFRDQASGPCGQLLCCAAHHGLCGRGPGTLRASASSPETGRPGSRPMAGGR